MSQDVKDTTFQGQTRLQLKKLVRAMDLKVMKKDDATKLAEKALAHLAENEDAYEKLADDLKGVAEAIGFTADEEEEEEENGNGAEQTQAPAAPSGDQPSYLLNADQLKKALDKQAEAAQNASTSYVPRLYLKDGDSKTVRFRDNTHITGVYYHAIQIKGRWFYFVCGEGVEVPDAEAVTCAFCAAGVNRSVRAVYEVIDRTEWTSKKDGQTHCHTPRLFETTQKLHQNIQKFADKGLLTGRDFEITRNGVQQAQYVLVPDMEESPEVPDGMDIPPRLRDNLGEFYKPLSQAEQLAKIAEAGLAGNVAEQEDV